ncbi:MAG: hypothetical protein H6Q14_677 [Bacteroidetes bacterium]|jgi:hypothetical protein|nr:hypothetical protein [Bacteroidota bacterium]
MGKSIFTTFCILGLFVFAPNKLVAKDSSFYAASSVLSSGTWYKIRVSADGIYKLTYADLKNMGISDPSLVEIRGYGGWMLDEDFSETYYDDLPQVAVWMNKGSDGVFNSGDYLLFYGRGPLKVTRSSQEFVQTNNPYSNYGYYFVSQGTVESLQMDSTASASVSSTDSVVTTYSDYLIHEEDEVNLLESGREFYGESFYSTTSQNITMDISGIVSWIGYRFDFISKPSSSVSLTLSLNGESIYSGSIGANTDSYSAGTVVNKFITGISTVSEDNIFNFKLGSSSTPNSYLNYLRVYFKRTLQSYGAVTFFRNEVDDLKCKYSIANATSNMMVFDVTGNILPTVQETSYDNGTLSFGMTNSSQHEFALVDLSETIPTPDIVGKISNQNLHALETAEMVIIAPSVYDSYAQELAEAHYENSGLTTLIVDPNDIYNEFSSGNPDATAYRRFMKMFYDRGSSADDRPKYLLLFGNGSYDNKFISSELSDTEKKGYLLTYQSVASTNERSSYVTDDYFGFLQEESALTIGSAKLCLGIGRFPIRSTDDAEVLVAKSIAYMNDSDPGIWKNNLCFLADDAVGATGYSPTSEMAHETQTDKYAEYVQSNYPNFIVNKIYMDSYKRVVQSNGNRYPDAQTALLKKINSGQLVVNYVGHGSSRDWAHEYIMTYSDFQSLTNTHLPLFITATCDFSRFDGDDVSGGEAALLNSEGGAIAMLSTVRVVYISNNDIMGTNIYKNIFQRDSDGTSLRFGDIIKRSKLSFTSSDENKVRFLLLGDPALRLSYPDSTYKVKVTKINDEDVSTATINISALSDVKLDGQIVDGSGTLVSDFNGKVSTVVFDAEQSLQTLDNGGDGSVFSYLNYLNTLFTGTLDVEDGVFSYEFVVPKDIMYSSDNGKMSFFAWESGGRSAQGSFLEYTVNGTDTTAESDSDGPEFTAFYLNTSDFVSGGKVNSTPMLYVGLEDASGINLSGGIGHVLELVVDGTTYYDITSNFSSSGTSTKEGYINYSIPELTEGKHTLKVTVWDVWNNYSEKSIDFLVDGSYKASVIEFSLAQNPVKEYARFLFSSNVPQSTLSIRYDVYSMAGELIWSHQETGASDSLENYSYDWDLKTNNGADIRPGIYICRLTVSLDGNQKSSKALKLIVLAK